LLEMAPCGVKGICIVKERSLDEECSTLSVKKITFWLLIYPPLRGTSWQEGINMLKVYLWGFTHEVYSTYLEAYSPLEVFGTRALCSKHILCIWKRALCMRRCHVV